MTNRKNRIIIIWKSDISDFNNIIFTPTGKGAKEHGKEIKNRRRKPNKYRGLRRGLGKTVRRVRKDSVTMVLYGDYVQRCVCRIGQSNRLFARKRHFEKITRKFSRPAAARRSAGKETL